MQFVAPTASSLARLNGIFPRKGIIAPGSDADIAIWDPKASVTIQAEKLHMTTDSTPHEGRSLIGLPASLFVRGRAIVRDGEFVASARFGRLIEAAPIFTPKQSR